MFVVLRQSRLLGWFWAGSGVVPGGGGRMLYYRGGTVEHLSVYAPGAREGLSTEYRRAQCIPGCREYSGQGYMRDPGTHVSRAHPDPGCARVGSVPGCRVAKIGEQRVPEPCTTVTKAPALPRYTRLPHPPGFRVFETRVGSGRELSDLGATIF